MNIDQLNQNYPGLEYLTEPLSESKDYSLTTDGFTAEIAIKSTGDILRLSKEHLTNLNYSKKFIKKGFHFIDTFSIITRINKVFYVSLQYRL